MSLLSQASLCVTPNAYKEGKLYSVIPSDGSGDFTFTRATTATRVNSDGLVELVPYNLLTYSEQFDNAAWVKINGTITPNTITSPSGVSNADTFTDNSTNGLHAIVRYGQWSTTQQTFTIYVKPNTLTKFFIANGSTGDAVFFDLTTLTVEGYTSGLGNPMVNPTITPMANGWIRLSATHTATASQTLSFGFYKVFNATSLAATATYIGTGETAYIWGAQLVEGTNALPYQKTETRLNIPRLDYSLGGCPNILLEPQRTNIALQSSSFDSATWGKSPGVIVTPNAAIAPDGTMTMDLINFTNTNESVNLSISFTSGATYTFSVWLATTSGTQTVGIGNITTGVYDTVTVTTTPQRFTITQNASASFRYPAIRSTGVYSIFAWGAQIEAGSYATSYIPTTTASVTRNADALTRNNIYTNGLITAAGGTWFVELRGNLSFVRDVYSTSLFIGSDAFATNALAIRNIGGAANRLAAQKLIGGIPTTLFTTTTDTCKIAFKWNGTTADVFVNGVKQVSATAFTTTALQFLNHTAPIDTPKFISSMLLAPTPLTDEQCSILTSDSYPTAAAAYASLGLVSESPSCLTSTTTF